MKRAIIDASTLMAICNEEEGAKEARAISRNGLISAVNLSEVFVCAMKRGNFELSQAIVQTLELEVIPFHREHAIGAAKLAATTLSKGISFADRACLSLGISLDSPIVTGDRIWAELDIGAEIVLFRPSVN